MYRIALTITNPQSGTSKQLGYQFDPALMTQTKWNNAYTPVKVEIDALVLESTAGEPETW